MDFQANDDQQAILEAVESLLVRHAGAERAIELARKGDVDPALEAALTESGFTEVALAGETGALEAALVVEAVSRAAGSTSAGAGVLVAPMVVGASLVGPVALARAGEPAPVRYAAQARHLLLDAGDEARLVVLERGSATSVRSSFGYPMGRLGPEAVDAVAGRSLGPGSGEALRRWWRLAVAAEAVGAMRAALDVTLDYTMKRRQFGRAIGSFQALQHRLAHCHVRVEGSAWLMREAAWRGAPAEAAAVAAAHAGATAGHVFAETHQMTGAMGFTHEHDLHVWSMRLGALRLELGGPDAHRREAARARWLS